ncbi:DUF502 domain-containing protein [Marinimicrobium alkaliphilum]|uniref:DUF502 domain-containing protein n=1 Tax=Marinimicrobium alkaliphilum TaxID=2202654 RepID=UPI000DB9CD75|nr:DUF502 domain-containing protein [Marinimicrobium alkaliphilum]
MKTWKSYLGLTLLGGLTVVLPITIFMLLIQWLFGMIADVVSPVSNLLLGWMPLNEYLADLISILMALGLCFAVGLLVKTGVGRWLHSWIDRWLTKFAPGYKTIREVVNQFVGGSDNESLLKGQVCRAYVFGPGNPVSMTAIITAKHDDGTYTVYVPTAPVPSSGLVYHLPAECVEILAHITVEAAMRTVISCGSGSQIITAPASGPVTVQDVNDLPHTPAPHSPRE